MIWHDHKIVHGKFFFYDKRSKHVDHQIRHPFRLEQGTSAKRFRGREKVRGWPFALLKSDGRDGLDMEQPILRQRLKPPS